MLVVNRSVYIGQVSSGGINGQARDRETSECRCFTGMRGNPCPIENNQGVWTTMTTTSRRRRLYDKRRLLCLQSENGVLLGSRNTEVCTTRPLSAC